MKQLRLNELKQGGIYKDILSGELCLIVIKCINEIKNIDDIINYYSVSHQNGVYQYIDIDNIKRIYKDSDFPFNWAYVSALKYNKTNGCYTYFQVYDNQLTNVD